MTNNLLINERRIKELEDEIERMKPVVEAARKWRKDYTAQDRYRLDAAIDLYETKLVATATDSTEG